MISPNSWNWSLPVLWLSFHLHIINSREPNSKPFVEYIPLCPQFSSVTFCVSFLENETSIWYSLPVVRKHDFLILCHILLIQECDSEIVLPLMKCTPFGGWRMSNRMELITNSDVSGLACGALTTVIGHGGKLRSFYFPLNNIIGQLRTSNRVWVTMIFIKRKTGSKEIDDI